MGIIPGLVYTKRPAVSLVQDQDIQIVDGDKADLTITVIGDAEENGVKHVTDVHVSSQVCMQSRYLQLIINVSDDPTEITLGGELRCSTSNKHDQDKGENREGVLVMLAHLHGLNEQRMEELGLYKISVLAVWYAIAYLERDQCGSAGATLKTWYHKWYAVSIEGVELNIDSARGLAMPCQLSITQLPSLASLSGSLTTTSDTSKSVRSRISRAAKACTFRQASLWVSGCCYVSSMSY